MELEKLSKPTAVHMSKEKKTYHLVSDGNKRKQLSPLYLISRERKAKK